MDGGDGDLLCGEARIRRYLMVERDPEKPDITDVKLRFFAGGLGRKVHHLHEDVCDSQPPLSSYRTLNIDTVSLRLQFAGWHGMS